MIKDLIRSGIKNFVPYDNTKQLPYRVKLDLNESPFSLSENVRKKLAQYVLEEAAFNLYPDTDSTALREAIGRHWKVDADQIVVGVGSDQIIQLLMNLFVDTGETVLCPAPSFGMYKLATLIAGGKPAEILLDEKDGFAYDAASIVKRAKLEKAKIVILCTPNSPTGNSIPREDLIQIAEGCRNSVVVIDEAYGEFSGETAIPLLEKFDNIVVLRTFSKAYGLAGMRCGYSVSSKDMAREMNTIRPPFNVSSFSQLAARLVLEDRDENERRIQEIKRQRDRLRDQLEAIPGIKVYPSQANFIMIGMDNAVQVAEALQQRGILVRSYGPGSPVQNCLRITVGSQEQNDILMAELRSLLG